MRARAPIGRGAGGRGAAGGGPPIQQPDTDAPVRADAVAGGWALVVADRGPGIDAETAEHLFEPFFTSKADGLGLGLNICRTIIESHGGHLCYDNRAEGGAVFFFTLPPAP